MVRQILKQYSLGNFYSYGLAEKLTISEVQVIMSVENIC